MIIPQRENCIHAGICKIGMDCMCPCECGYFEEHTQSSDTWISVKDRLPEFGIEYLLYNANSAINRSPFVSIITHGNFYIDIDGRCTLWIIGDNGIEITHWMELPKPPAIC